MAGSTPARNILCIKSANVQGFLAHKLVQERRNIAKHSLFCAHDLAGQSGLQNHSGRFESVCALLQIHLSLSPSGRWQRPSKPPYAGSNPARDTVAVADMVMQRSVEPPYAGSTPVSHLLHSQALMTVTWLFFALVPQVHMWSRGIFYWHKW